MLHGGVESPTPPATDPRSSPSSAPTVPLVALSRNASVISSSSSNSSSSSLPLSRPRPLRTFSSPRNRSPATGPPTPRAQPYLAKELLNDSLEPRESPTRAPINKSRSNSAAGRVSRNDFEFREELGSGSYSEVMSAVHVPTGKAYAIKIIDKAHLIRKQMVEIANIEKKVLTRLMTGGGHPGIVKLYWAFQDQWHLYFVLDLVPNGELQTRISRLGSISLDCARWYTAQMIDATAWMHEKAVMHRDLKPENMLLDENMRIKITDFGSAKIFEPGKEDGSNSWVGTPQFVPPELLNNNVTCPSSDYWAIGCILYQMISGQFPFIGASNYLMWAKIKSLEYTFPEGFDEDARDLVQKLLVLDPDSRLGAGKPGSSTDVTALRAHPFFKHTSWNTVWTDPVPPLEAGLVKREITNGSDNFDVGAEWERLVGAEIDQAEEESPVDPQEGDTPSMSRSRVTESTTTAAGPAKEERGYVPMPPLPPPRSSLASADVRDSHSSSSGSSPGASPTEKLGGLLESLSFSRGRRSSRGSASASFANRARWLPLLRPSETTMFYSIVYKAPRRMFPRQLIQLPGSMKKGTGLQSRDKDRSRLLVLTKTRLLCLKERDRVVVVNNEALIGGEGTGNGFVTGVEEKGDNSFVVHTASKSYAYVTEDAALKHRWIRELSNALPAILRPTHQGNDSHEET